MQRVGGGIRCPAGFFDRVMFTPSCIAAALYIRSAARYNDGSSAVTVTLAALDGIVLQREVALYLPVILRTR